MLCLLEQKVSKKWCMARLQYKVTDYPKGDLSYYDEDFKYKKKLVFRE